MLRAGSLAMVGAVLVACSDGGGGSSGSTSTSSGAGTGGGASTASSGTAAGGTGGTSTSGGTGGTSTSSSTGATSTSGSTGGGEMIGPGPYFLSYSSRGGPGIDSRPSVTATFAGNEITGYVASPNESPTRGTSTTAEPGMDAFVAWGRWTGGTTAGVLNAKPGIVLSAMEGFHLALGLKTAPASVPASGGATYVLIGATHPTLEDGSLALGTLTGAMNVSFAGASTKVGFALSIDMPGDTTYAVTTNGGTGTPSTSEVGSVAAVNPARIGGAVIVTSAGKACTGGASCKATFQGFIAGPNSDRVALVFTLSAGMLGTQVRGVAVFERQ